MYCNFEEFVFIVMALICANIVMKLIGSVMRGFKNFIITIGAKTLRAEIDKMELMKAYEKASKEIEK